MAGSVYGIREKVKGTNGFLLLGSSIIATIVFNYFFNYLNKKISQKHRYYEKKYINFKKHIAFIVK